MASLKDPNQLPDDVNALKQMVIDLKNQVDILKRMVFGRRSEKRHDDAMNDVHQGFLFGPIDPDAEDTEEQESKEEEEDPEAVPEPRRKKKRPRHRGRRPLPEHVMRCLHEIHPAEGERTCPCCQTPKTIFGQDVTEELEMIPAKFFVNRYVRYKYACPVCEGYVSQGLLPPRPMDKGIPGPGVLAEVVANKYANHLPLYRQQEMFERVGLTFPRSTLCGWVAYVASLLVPIVDSMKLSVLASRKIHTDDTPITVLDRSIKPVGSRRGYMWVYVGDQDDVVFDYTNARNRDGPESFLKGYRGYLQADAFSGYDRLYLEQLIIEVACWAHARRKFFDARTSHPTEVERILALIGELYTVEAWAKAFDLPDEKLLAWRHRYSRPRLVSLREELDALSVRVLPKSPLGKAITYTLKNWKALNRYTEAAFLDIDNNLSERQIKQMVIGRKNWLFAGSERGARNAAILFSVIVSCKLQGVDPFAYLRDVLTRIPTHPKDRMHELTPREWKQRFAPDVAPESQSAA
jgi:transposase